MFIPTVTIDKIIHLVHEIRDFLILLLRHFGPGIDGWDCLADEIEPLLRHLGWDKTVVPCNTHQTCELEGFTAEDQLVSGFESCHGIYSRYVFS